jgi:hypothetical protein
MLKEAGRLTIRGKGPEKIPALAPMSVSASMSALKTVSLKTLMVLPRGLLLWQNHRLPSRW